MVLKGKTREKYKNAAAKIIGPTNIILPQKSGFSVFQNKNVAKFHTAAPNAKIENVIFIMDLLFLKYTTVDKDRFAKNANNNKEFKDTLL